MIKVMLARKATSLKPYATSDVWVMQQKFDGERMLIESGERVQCYNRRGEPLPTPRGIEVEPGLGWVLDGEILSDRFHVFDAYPIEGEAGTFINRYHKACKIATEHASEKVVATGLHRGTEHKLGHVELYRKENREGVIFKNVNGKYKNGRSNDILKYKFTKDVDCVVMEVGTDKYNMTLGMYDPETMELVDVGSVSSLTGDGPSVKEGMVVKITCLYVGANGRLYQPVTPRIRTDKTPAECTIDQLKDLKTNKS